MIHSFSCKNFYSFEDTATVDFEVNNNAPQNNGYFEGSSKIRLSKIEAVVGPNASGKTNLLKVLPFLKWIIADSFNSKPDDPVMIRPFAFGDAVNQPTELSVVFEVDGVVYTYGFTMIRERILTEKLERTTFAKEKKGTKKVFYREWNAELNRYEFDGNNFELPKGFEGLLRSNASIIGTAARLNQQEAQVIAKYWQKIETNVVEAGWTGDNLLPNKIPQWFEALIFYSQNENLKKEAEGLLSRFDLGLSGIIFEKEKNEDNLTIKNIQAKHSFGGEEHSLPIMYESSGTKQLFVLLKSILSALENGGIAVIDEFDVNLHPEMVTALLNLFVNSETNPNNAQLLLSTHSHLLLSDLDKYQIVLVEKNENGASEAWRLDDVEGVRPDDNYFAKYIAGAYGAVPKI
ncbi:MAG: ATP-binding protein [Patescibacteria group bacterium]|nr:ATP-binding protein [Patescibacteria group bacterium]